MGLWDIQYVGYASKVSNDRSTSAFTGKDSANLMIPSPGGKIKVIFGYSSSSFFIPKSVSTKEINK